MSLVSCGRLACVAGVLIALGLVTSSRLNAQGAASASGTVTDSSGAVIPKASVQLKNIATGQVLEARESGLG